MTVPTPSLAESGENHWLMPVMEMAALAGWEWPPPADRAYPFPYPRIATHTPSMGPGCAAAARGFTAATLRRWGVTGRCDDIVTVVSELVTNAWRHARPGRTGTARWRPAELGLLQAGCGVLCAMADASPEAPLAREPGQLAESGRGLTVIGGLSDSWGCAIRAASGKVVWAVFGVGPALPRAGLGGWPALP